MANGHCTRVSSKSSLIAALNPRVLLQSKTLKEVGSPPLNSSSRSMSPERPPAECFIFHCHQLIHMDSGVYGDGESASGWSTINHRSSYNMSHGFLETGLKLFCAGIP